MESPNNRDSQILDAALKQASVMVETFWDIREDAEKPDTYQAYGHLRCLVQLCAQSGRNVKPVRDRWLARWYAYRDAGGKHELLDL
ncbi:hypothetical protein [Microbispora sp. CSR-4]|uniref:hypothetical protein n=1 Tax=Microbispora sp. CSR-4 TaxID=2592813 RepID=UPI0011C7E1EA|nr:hypothetical protein [Microbispora sp. CSR-4]